MRKLGVYLFAAGVLLVGGLSGCSGTLTHDKVVAPTEIVPGTDTPPNSTVEEVVESEPPRIPLTPDIIYSVLVGEIAAQRDYPDMAANYYKLAAKLSGDARTAERAARIAVYLNQVPAAREAIDLWVSLEPDNAAAYQVAANFYGQQRDTVKAVAHLKQLVRLSEGQRLKGFMQAAGVTGKLKDREYGLQLMQRLVADYEADDDALYAYAVVAAGAGYYDQAESSIRQVLSLQPDRAEASVLLSRILLRNGDHAAALSVLALAVEKQPDNLVLRSAYARRLVEEHRLEPAYRQFQMLLKMRPESREALFSAGIVALQLKDLSAARQYLTQLIEQGGKRDEVAYYLGQLEEMDGRYPAAVEWYAQVSGTYQLDAEVRRARLVAKLGNLDQAREIIQRLRVQESEQSVKLLLIEGEIIRELGDPDDAMHLYDEALLSYPNNADLLYTRALFAADLGRLDILETDLRRVLKDDPNNADALNALGYTLADKTSRYQEALEYIERALDLKPDNAAVLDSMGWVQYRLGNHEKALYFLRKAMQRLPDAEIAAHLGEVLWVAGDQDQARKVWEDGLENSPDDKRLKQLIRNGVQGL